MSQPRTPWITAAWYLWAALGAIPMYYWMRSTSSLPGSAWEGSTPFDRYFGPSLIYHGAAGLCALRLLGRRAEAVRPAWFVALWAVLGMVSSLWAWSQGREIVEAMIWVSVFQALVFTAFAFHIKRLTKRGVLHAQNEAG